MTGTDRDAHCGGHYDPDGDEQDCADLAQAMAESSLELARLTRTLLVNEQQSALGPRQHLLAVMRRIRQGDPGAVQLDGHFLLSELAYEEELAMAARDKQDRTRRGTEGEA